LSLNFPLWIYDPQLLGEIKEKGKNSGENEGKQRIAVEKENEFKRKRRKLREWKFGSKE